MRAPVDTCPNCGALVTPQLARCRQCKRYLHGTQVEGFLLEHLLPARLAAAPGTGVFFLAIILYYVLMALLAGFDSAVGFGSFSLTQLGSLWAPAIWEGELWRFFTSMLAHGDLLHLAFNLYALTIVGPLIEELFDRKKMMLIYLVSGVLSMVTSHTFSVEVLAQLNNSVGASGAISGLIGACLIGARRRGPDGRQVAQIMLRWTAYMAIIGFLPGIDNAAHAGGWLVGAGLAAITPLGITQSRPVHLGLSLTILGLLSAVLVSVGLMLAQARGVPLSFERTRSPGHLLFFTLREPVEWDVSDERIAIQDCETQVKALRKHDRPGTPKSTHQAISQCRVATRAAPSPHYMAHSYRLLAEAYERGGQPKHAEKAYRIAMRLIRGR